MPQSTDAGNKTAIGGAHVVGEQTPEIARKRVKCFPQDFFFKTIRGHVEMTAKFFGKGFAGGSRRWRGLHGSKQAGAALRREVFCVGNFRRRPLPRCSSVSLQRYFIPIGCNFTVDRAPEETSARAATMPTPSPARSQRDLIGSRAHPAMPSQITRGEATAKGSRGDRAGLGYARLGATARPRAGRARGPCRKGPRLRARFCRRAGVFRAALAPIERLHRSTRESCRHRQPEKDGRQRRAVALFRSNRRLERAVGPRRAGELALRQGTQKTPMLFDQAQLMQKKMRLLPR